MLVSSNSPLTALVRTRWRRAANVVTSRAEIAPVPVFRMILTLILILVLTDNRHNGFGIAGDLASGLATPQGLVDLVVLSLLCAPATMSGAAGRTGRPHAGGTCTRSGLRCACDSGLGCRGR